MSKTNILVWIIGFIFIFIGNMFLFNQGVDFWTGMAIIVLYCIGFNLMGIGLDDAF